MSVHLPVSSNEGSATRRTPQGALNRPRMDGRRLICIVGALLFGCLSLASGFASPAAMARVRAQTQLNGRHHRGALYRRSAPLAMTLTGGAASKDPTRARGAGSFSDVARRICAFLAVLATAVLLAGARPAMASGWTSSMRHDAPSVTSSASASPVLQKVAEMVDPRIQTPSQATNAGSRSLVATASASASAAQAAATEAARVPTDAWEAAAVAGFTRITRSELMAMQPKLLVQRAPGYSFGSAAFRMAIKYLVGILMSFFGGTLFFRRRDH